jgi:large subunit ribosomal protein L21
MYAVFETGGKQYKAAKGDVVWVEKLSAEPGKAVSFDALVVSDGDKVQIGTPVVKGVKVKAKVVAHGKEDKVIIYKYKSKDNSRRKQGHRQPYTKIEITGIGTGKAADDEKVKEVVVVEEAATEAKEAPKAKTAPKAKAADVEAAAEISAAPKAKAKATKAVKTEE